MTIKPGDIYKRVNDEKHFVVDWPVDETGSASSKWLLTEHGNPNSEREHVSEDELADSSKWEVG